MPKRFKGPQKMFTKGPTKFEAASVRCHDAASMWITVIEWIEFFWNRRSDATVTYPWSYFLDLVRIPTLVELTISHNHFDKPRNETDTILVMKNLKHFRCSDKNMFRRMWKLLAFPNLELLVLQWIFVGGTQYPYNSQGSPTQPQDLPILAPNLHTLAIANCSVGYHPRIYPLHSLASATASVTKLVVVDQRHSQDDNVFDSFVKYADKHLWPNANTTTFKRYSHEDSPIYTPWELLEFLKVRHRKKIQKLRLCVDGDAIEAREEWREEWEELVDSGLVEDVPWKEDVIPWPAANKYFFSDNSYVPFDPYEDAESDNY